MVLEVTLGDGKKVDAHINGNVIKTDQPITSGGEGTAASPFDHFLASIGTCAGIYVKSFCAQRDIPTENIRLIQTMHFNPEKKLIDRIEIEVKLPADFPEKYKDAVIKVADMCTVKKHLHSPPEIVLGATIG